MVPWLLWNGWTKFRSKVRMNFAEKWIFFLDCTIAILLPWKGFVLRGTRGSGSPFQHFISFFHKISVLLPFDVYFPWITICRFLVYEYMENGSLNDHLHCNFSISFLLPFEFMFFLFSRKSIIPFAYAAPKRNPLSWKTRVQIAIDVANALVKLITGIIKGKNKKKIYYLLDVGSYIMLHYIQSIWLIEFSSIPFPSIQV